MIDFKKGPSILNEGSDIIQEDIVTAQEKERLVAEKLEILRSDFSRQCKHPTGDYFKPSSFSSQAISQEQSTLPVNLSQQKTPKKYTKTKLKSVVQRLQTNTMSS